MVNFATRWVVTLRGERCVSEGNTRGTNNEISQARLVRGVPETQPHYLITGASTGIGRHAAEYLAGEGAIVFAGARRSADLEALGLIDNIVPVRLDVTSHDDIAAAVELVEKQTDQLHGLVNNAGVAFGGPIAVLAEEDLRTQLEINVFGVFRVTKAFFPLLHAGKGCVVNISSVSGTFTAPFMGPYSMSKFALEAYSDALRREVSPHGYARRGHLAWQCRHTHLGQGRSGR